MQAPDVTLARVASFVREHRLARVELSNEDLKTVLDTLVADGRWAGSANQVPVPSTTSVARHSWRLSEHSEMLHSV